MARMPASEALRHQGFHVHPRKFRPGVTKQFRRARVRVADHPLGVRDKNCVWRELKEVLQRQMGNFGASQF